MTSKTHIIAKFSVDFLLVHHAAFLGQEEKFFKMGPQQLFLCTEDRQVRQAVPLHDGIDYVCTETFSRMKQRETLIPAQV